MKKIYLVKAQKISDLENENANSYVDEIFSNKKLAEAYVKYWNNTAKYSYHFWIIEFKICNADYRDLVKVNF